MRRDALWASRPAMVTDAQAWLLALRAPGRETQPRSGTAENSRSAPQFLQTPWLTAPVGLPITQ